MSANFNINFIINEKTQTRVLRLTDTSTGFTLAKGNFSITFPDGSTRIKTDFTSPDIILGGASIDVLAVLSNANQVLTGNYKIDFVALDGADVQYTSTKTFDFNWVKPTSGIVDYSDSIIPQVQFKDDNSYSPIGSFTGSVTRAFSTAMPSNSEVSGQTITSNTDILVPSISNKYYEGIYTVYNEITGSYTHNISSWLTISYVERFSGVFDVRQTPNQIQLIDKINTYREYIDSLKNKNQSLFELISEKYDLVIALYSHLIARFESGLSDGSQDILKELLSYIEPYVTHTYQSTEMTPFDLANQATSGITVSDGTNNDFIGLGQILTFLSSSAALSYVINNNILTVTPNFGNVQNSFAQGNDARFHDAVTIGTANGLSLANQQVSLATATQSAAGAMSAADKTKIDNLGTTYQPLDADLTAIAGIVATSGLLKKTAANTWTLDTNTYLTAETDPIFIASPAYNITSTNISNWNTAYGWGNHAIVGYLLASTAASTYQPLDADLTAIAALSGTSGLLKKTAANTWTLDTNTYLTTISGIAAGGELSGTYANPSLVNSAVIGKVLTGLNTTGGGSISATDSILIAFGKLQNQVSTLSGAVIYQGVWNATTNSPTLTSSTGTKGYYYKVQTAGSTNLDGTTDWKVGDWAIYNGTTWDKIDNTDSVSSVNGFTGAVSLVTDNVNEGSTNLYYTNARATSAARLALSLTTTGTSGAATYDNSTGVLNIPQYQTALTNPVTGTGTANYLAKFNSSTGITSSQIFDDGSNVAIGNTTTAISGATLSVYGNVSSVNMLALRATSSGASPATLLIGASTPSEINFTAFNSVSGTTTYNTINFNAFDYNFKNVTYSGGIPTTTSIFTLSSVGNAVFTGSVTANSLKKSGGLSTQYLMADGSVSTLTNPVTGTGTTNYLPKWTSSSAIGNSLIYDNGTNLGIGTTSPNELVHLNKASASWTGISFTNTATGTTASDGSFIGIDTTGNTNIINYEASSIIFKTSNTTRLTLDSSGNLGLGVTPSAWSVSGKVLELAGNSGNGSLFNNGVNDFWISSNVYFNGTNWIYKNDGYSTQYHQANGKHEWYIAGSGLANGTITYTQAMTLDASGNLMVGTTSAPYGKFTLKSNSATTYAGLNVFANSNTKFISLNHTGTIGVIETEHQADTQSDMAFRTGGGERVRITTAGNVGIGTTSPNNFSYGKALTILASSGYAGVEIMGAGTTSGGQLDFGSSTTRWASITGEYQSATNGQILFRTNRVGTMTNAMLINSTGNVSIGNTNDTYKLDVSGTGYFSDKLIVSQAGSAVVGLEVKSTNATSYNSTLIYGNTVDAGTNNFNFLGMYANGVAKFTVSGTGNNYLAGNLSVGTTTTSYKFNWASGSNFGFLDNYAGGAVFGSTGGVELWSGATPARRIRINASGNVSIGNTNDTYKLDVSGSIISRANYLIAPNGTSIVYNIVDSDATYAGVYSLQAGGGSAGYGGSLVMYGHAHATRAGYVSAGISSGSNGKFTVMSQANGSGSDLFVVQQDGKVGIGTTSPATLLHISSSFGELVRLEGTSTGNSTNYYSAKNGSGDVMQIGIANLGYTNASYPAIVARGAYLYSPRDLGIIAENGYPIIFQTGATERLRITNGGNVGIGITTPNLKLTVFGNNGGPNSSGTTQNGVLRLTGGTGLYNVLDFGINETNDYSWIQSTRANTLAVYDKLSLNPLGGNVGIGTTSPSAKLDINSGAGAGSTDLLSLSRSSGYGNTTFTQTYDSTYFTAGKTLTLKNDSGTAFAHFAGNNAGTVTNFLLPTGNVGIGTATPSAKLDVSSGSIRLSNTFQIEWGGTSTAIDGSNANNTMRFWTSDTERMRITSTGNIGIGTTSPSYLLHVKGSGAYNGAIFADNTGTTGGGSFQVGVNGTSVGSISSGGTYFGNTDQNMSYYAASGLGHIFFTNGSASEKMRLTSAGYLGIGVYNPQNLLEVRKDQAADTAIWITNRNAASTSATNSIIFGGYRDSDANHQVAKISVIQSASAAAGDLEHRGSIAFYTQPATTSTNPEVVLERMRINWDGNIGIGTVSPSYKLDVAGDIVAGLSGAANKLRVARPSDGNQTAAYLGFESTSSNTDFILANNSGGGNLVFKANSSERMRIDGSGNVGIGTTSPSDKLDVSGNISLGNAGNKLYNGASADSAGLYFNSSQVNIAGYSGIIFRASTTNVASQTERMRITSVGNLGLGTSSPNIAGFGSNATVMTIRGQNSSANSSGVLELAAESNNTAAGNYIGVIDFVSQYNTTNKELALIGAYIEGSTANNVGGNLRFFTKADAGSLTERLRITADGRFGIGTQSPPCKLYIASDTTVATGQTSHNGVNKHSLTGVKAASTAATLRVYVSNYGTGLLSFTYAHSNDGDNGAYYLVYINNSYGTIRTTVVASKLTTAAGMTLTVTINSPGGTNVNGAYLQLSMSAANASTGVYGATIEGMADFKFTVS